MVISDIFLIINKPLQVSIKAKCILMYNSHNYLKKKRERRKAFLHTHIRDLINLCTFYAEYAVAHCIQKAVAS